VRVWLSWAAADGRDGSDANIAVSICSVRYFPDVGIDILLLQVRFGPILLKKSAVVTDDRC
jgi:hypothetical protein